MGFVPLQGRPWPALRQVRVSLAFLAVGLGCPSRPPDPSWVRLQDARSCLRLPALSPAESVRAGCRIVVAVRFVLGLAPPVDSLRSCGADLHGVRDVKERSEERLLGRSPQCPSESSAWLVIPGCYHTRVVLFGLATRSESSSRTVPPTWVERPHFAVSRFFGCVVFPHETSLATVKSPVEPSLEFRLRLESHRTTPSRPAAASQLLSWAFAPYST
jgi:hypothetical protein